MRLLAMFVRLFCFSMFCHWLDFLHWSTKSSASERVAKLWAFAACCAGLFGASISAGLGLGLDSSPEVVVGVVCCVWWLSSTRRLA